MSDHAPTSRKVKTVIDGREIEVARDTWALEAARRMKARGLDLNLILDTTRLLENEAGKA